MSWVQFVKGLVGDEGGGWVGRSQGGGPETKPVRKEEGSPKEETVRFRITMGLPLEGRLVYKRLQNFIHEGPKNGSLPSFVRHVPRHGRNPCPCRRPDV